MSHSYQLVWEEEPDQHFLDMIGMTKEEYLQKDLELKAAAEADDAALITVEEVEEEAEEWGSNHPATPG